MTAFAKTIPRTEIQFTAEHLTLLYYIPRNTEHIAIDGKVCFHTQFIAYPVKLPRCTTVSLGPVNGINKNVSGAMD